MTNYCSFGVDAQVALKFHTLRETNPSLFVSQTLNKARCCRPGASSLNVARRSCFMPTLV